MNCPFRCTDVFISGLTAVLVIVLSSQLVWASRWSLQDSKGAGLESGQSPAEQSIRILGTVVDENKQPASRIVVWAKPADEVLEVITGDDGNFSLSVPASDGIGLLIQARTNDGTQMGFVLARRNESTDESARHTIQISPVRKIEVAVGGMKREPLANVQVGVMLVNTVLATEVSDENGKATLVVPSNADIASVYAFSAQYGIDYRSFERGAKHADGQEPLPQEILDRPISFRLGPNQNFTVTASDQGNKPLAGVRVYPSFVRKEGESAGLNLSVIDFHLKNVGETSDSNGVVRFSWLPGWHKKVLHFHAGMDGFAGDNVDFHPGSDSRDLTVQIIPLVPVSGVVRFQDGTPAAGLSMRFHGFGLKAGESSGTSSVWNATTDAEGRFWKLLHPHQSYLGILENSEYAFAASTIFPVSDTPAQTDLDFVVRPATRVFGRVTAGKDRKPIVNERLFLTHYDELDIPIQGGKGIYRSSPALASAAFTNENGEFEFRTGAGKYWIRGPASGELIRFEIADETEKKLVFHSEKEAKGIVSIELLDGETPVRGEVQAAYSASKAQGNFGFKKFESDENGKVELERELFPLVLFAQSSDGKLFGLVDIEAEQSVVKIKLLPPVTARGRLVDGAGYPMPGEEIRFGRQIVMNDDGHQFFSMPWQIPTETGVDGAFLLEDLVPEAACTLNFTIVRGERWAASWRSIHEFIPKADEPETDLGDLVVDRKSLHRPLRPVDRILEAFRSNRIPVDKYKTVVSDSIDGKHNVLVLFGNPDANSIDPLAKLLFDNPDTKLLLSRFGKVFVDSSRERIDEARELASQIKVELEPDRFDFQIVIVKPDGVRVGGANSSDLVDEQTGDLDKALFLNLLTETIADPLDAQGILGDATHQAKQENKRVLLLETETSSAQSMVFSRFLDRTEGIWGKDYVLVRMDRRWIGSASITQKYRGDSEGGIPWYAILDSDFNALATSNDAEGHNIGLSNDAAGKQHLAEMLKRTAIRLTEKEIETVVGELDER